MIIRLGKNIIRIHAVLLILFLWIDKAYVQNVIYPRDIYKVKSAKMTERGSIDFKLFSTIQKLKERRISQSVIGDTLIDFVHSDLNDIIWNFKYGYKDNVEFNIAGVSFFDKQGSKFRFGAGDVRLGVKFGYPKRNSNFNTSMELYYLMPTGYNEGNRLVRSFSRGKGGFGFENAVEFNFNHVNFLVNLGYFHNKDMYEEIPTEKFIAWYPLLSGYQGLTSDGEIINSRQFSFGIGAEVDLIFGRTAFLEYRSGKIFAKTGDSKTIGKVAAGISLTKGDNIIVKVGYETSTLGALEPNSSIFLDIRLNSVFKSRRVRGPTTPTITERPTLEPGGKPFFVREGVVFSKIREPITDNIIIIDSSPSMVGRGTDQNNRGENVLNDIVDFSQTIVDSVTDNSNMSLITFSNSVNVITWRNVNDPKREDIKNSIKDIPDEVLRVLMKDLNYWLKQYQEHMKNCHLFREGIIIESTCRE
jgi:hypothetical protein